jgi:CRISPR-associated exonuclease Cas4
MEVKVSSALEQPARMQLLFYLWYLREVHGVEKDGILAYPTERNREPVKLNTETTAQVEATVEGILETVAAETPPPLEKKSYCGSCLYQDLCWM